MHPGFCQILLLGSSHVGPLEGIQTQILDGPLNTQEYSLPPWHRVTHTAELPCTGLAQAKIAGKEKHDGLSHVLQCFLL